MAADRLDELKVPISLNLAGLKGELGAANQLVARAGGQMSRSLERVTASQKNAAEASRTLGKALSATFADAIVRGRSLSDVLRGLSRRLAQIAFDKAFEPLERGLSGGLKSLVGGLFASAAGNAFAQGRPLPLARGGVVSGPAFFPLRGGRTGLMGEAGPEAVLPLARTADGRLGVRSASAGTERPVQITFHVTTPDAESFRRSESQIGAMLHRAARRGARNL